MLDWTQYRLLLRDLALMQVKSVTFTGGGEPLMHPRFNSMLEMALAGGFEAGLITNGVRLDQVEPALVEQLKFVRVSLDASCRELYARIKGRDCFDRALNGIRSALELNAMVGISYVVCEENRQDLEAAAALAESLDAAYIQFKPALVGGRIFTDYQLPDGGPVIATDRYSAEDMLPCAIAQLVGVVSATGEVYYCCQHRGNAAYALGNLAEDCFPDIWLQRGRVAPDIASCPQCRYMNYARSYRAIVENGTMFFDHRRFL